MTKVLRTPSKLNASGDPDTSSGDNNFGQYSNKNFDDLVDRFKVENDLKKRDLIIRDALLLVNRELPIVTLHKPIIPWAMSARAGNEVSAVLPPNGVPYFFRFNSK